LKENGTLQKNEKTACPSGEIGKEKLKEILELKRPGQGCHVVGNDNRGRSSTQSKKMRKKKRYVHRLEAI